jgi:protocatechuate 3,4-dioxygenase beta subunit
MENARLTRRGAVVGLGGLFASLLSDRWASGAGAANVAGPAAVASGAVKCVLTPEQTEGPYYIAGEKLRRDITEGKSGVPLSLRPIVVDVSTCRPIRGAVVDIWHCDAGGVYSGFGEGAGNRTFLRGVQRTDAHGLAIFRTIYPGWYPGRTVHIHVKVHLGGNVVHTGQLYFPEGITDAVYGTRPYSAHGPRDTRNADDAIFRNGGRNSMLNLRRVAGGYVGAITMGVQRG